MSYKEHKARAKDEIISFASEIFEIELSWGELAEYQTRIEKVAKKYGLIRELRAEGVL